MLLAAIMPSTVSFLQSTLCRASPFQVIRRLETSMSSDRPQRLDKLLANRGIGTRTQVTKLINQGKVTVDGIVVRSGAKKVDASSATVLVEGIDEEIRPPPLLVAYHKPLGVLSTMGDNWNRPNLEKLPEKFPVLRNMHPVGRLDADTSGLLLFSSLGDLTQHLLNPNSKVPREYVAVVEGKVVMEDLKSKLAEGIKTTSGIFSARLLEAEILSEQREIESHYSKESDENDGIDDNDSHYGEDIHRSIETLNMSKNVVDGRINSDVGKDGEISKLVDCSRIRLSVCEGKYRMVRRILHNAGHSVISLHRMRFGEVALDSNLTKRGEIRECTEEESMWAKSLIALRLRRSAKKNKYRRKDLD